MSGHVYFTLYDASILGRVCLHDGKRSIIKAANSDLGVLMHSKDTPPPFPWGIAIAPNGQLAIVLCHGTPFTDPSQYAEGVTYHNEHGAHPVASHAMLLDLTWGEERVTHVFATTNFSCGCAIDQMSQFAYFSERDTNYLWRIDLRTPRRLNGPFSLGAGKDIKGTNADDPKFFTKGRSSWMVHGLAVSPCNSYMYCGYHKSEKDFSKAKGRELHYITCVQTGPARSSRARFCSHATFHPAASVKV